MKSLLLRTVGLYCCLIGVCLRAGYAYAEAPLLGDDEYSGFTILSNATNVTHWGLGAGVGVESSPYRGDKSKVSAIPLVDFDDKWVHLLGTTLDLKVGRWSNVSFALRAHFALFDGYNQSDSPILNGMKDRKGALWYGPAVSWNGSLGTVSGEYLFGGNKGEQASIEFSHEFELEKWSIKPHVGTRWLSNKFVDYYYGVLPEEARAGRSTYTGKATWEFSAGSEFDYHLTAHQEVLVDLGVTHLGSGETDSPLVGRRYVPQARIGYIYQFK